MKLTWLEREHLEDRDIAGMVAVWEATRLVDHPQQQIATTVDTLSIRLRRGWDGEPPEVAVVRNDRGRIVGQLELYLPQRDNTHMGYLDAAVDPLLRRQGIGKLLLEAAVDRLRTLGRRLIMSGSSEGRPGADFLAAHGFELASTAVQRRQQVLTLDWDRLARDYAEAERAAEGYELLRIVGPVAEDMIDAVVTMTAAINDAPTDDLDVEDEVFSAERIREFEKTQGLLKRRTYRLVAREKATGELAGHTMVAVESQRPAYAWQFDTSVLRTHRGHRLGLLLKAGMLRWLADEEPQIRVIDTWNAATNSHMIGVNETLGYEVVSREGQWQKAI